MTFRRRLTSKQREALWHSEAEKARERMAAAFVRAVPALKALHDCYVQAGITIFNATKKILDEQRGARDLRNDAKLSAFNLQRWADDGGRS